MENWEVITEHSAHIVERLKTPTGWLILSRVAGWFSVSISTTFVPDPDHEWV